jgi:hypothetical protein
MEMDSTVYKSKNIIFSKEKESIGIIIDERYNLKLEQSIWFWFWIAIIIIIIDSIDKVVL